MSPDQVPAQREYAGLPEFVAAGALLLPVAETASSSCYNVMHRAVQSPADRKRSEQEARDTTYVHTPGAWLRQEFLLAAQKIAVGVSCVGNAGVVTSF